MPMTEVISGVATPKNNLFLEEKIILFYEINISGYFIRLSVLIACFPTKLYKYQVFLWWRFFSRFSDSLKILGGGIYFKLIGSFLYVGRQ